MSRTFDLLKRTLRDFSRDRCPQMAAALSYYTVFALPPLLVLILALVGVFVDPQDLHGRIVAEIRMLLGTDGARLISGMIADANRPGKGITAVAGGGALLLGATGAFAQLQEALNTAWEVKPDPKQGGIKSFLGKRVLSFGMILVIAFLLLVSFVLSALVSAFGDMVGGALGGVGKLIAQAVHSVVGFGVAWLLFAAIFKFLPDVLISWRDVRLGAFVTALLFTAGRFAIGFCLGRSEATDAFGAAAALAILFVWIYYAAIILLIGAEFTQVWARWHDREIEPAPGAVRIA